MKYIWLLYKNVMRNRRRTLLTVTSIAVSLFLVTTLLTLLNELQNPIETPASALRLITRHKVSLFNSLPIAYRQKIAKVDGVAVGVALGLVLACDLVVAAAEGRLLREERDQVVVGLAARGLVRRRPDGAAAHVAQVEELAPRVSGRILAMPRHRASPAEARAPSGVGDNGHVVTV
jgi:hypothetical protein